MPATPDKSAAADRFIARRERLKSEIRKTGAEGLLVTNYTNVTYLTGFTGDDSYLLVADGGDILISDARYTTQLQEECPGLELHIRPVGSHMSDEASGVVERVRLGKLGIESDSMTVGLRDKIAGKLSKVALAPTSGLVEQLRICKDADEIAQIRQAAEIAERAFAVLRGSIRPEQTEKEVADALENQMRQFGAKKASFEPIIAVGPRAALPHARPSSMKIGDDDFVLIDWGADGRLYKSDLTRVLVTGKIPPKLETVYGVVLKAQLAGIAAIRPGVLGKDVDRAARSVIEEAGYGEFFGHGLGHGLGLDIHEAPRLNCNNDKPLEPGMVITVEPGIYLPGWGGVRIEDDVLVTSDGHELLTSAPKTWEEAILA